MVIDYSACQFSSRSSALLLKLYNYLFQNWCIPQIHELIMQFSHWEKSLVCQLWPYGTLMVQLALHKTKEVAQLSLCHEDWPDSDVSDA